jgi:predicted nuclease of predicted toxin-antitoxin system
MKFKVDENLPVEIAMALVAKGYEASTVLEQKLGGEHDQNIAAICRRESQWEGFDASN